MNRACIPVCGVVIAYVRREPDENLRGINVDEVMGKRGSILQSYT